MAQRTNPIFAATSDQKRMEEDMTMKPKGLHSVTQRLQKELMSLMLTQENGVSAFPEGDNVFKWIATIKGPDNTVFSGYTYKLFMEFPNTYPYSPPEVKFTTPCYHPNVDTNGNICLDILKDKWSPLLDVRSVLVSIQSLLGDPNIASPLNLEAAELWGDQEEYKKALQAFQKQDRRLD